MANNDSNLLRTSLHEAAHLVVGNALGRRGTIYLWRDHQAQVAWHGRVRFDEDAHEWSADDRAMVAFAGTVCEELNDGQKLDAQITHAEAATQRQHGSILFLSNEDLHWAGDFEVRHVERACLLVETHIARIKSEASSARKRALAEPGGCGRPPPE